MADQIQPPTVSLVNLKGGVGKTALSVNLAYALAEWHDMRVLLVDIDPQFNATQHLLDETVIVAGLEGTIKDILDPPAPTIGVGTGKKTKKKRSSANPRRFLHEIGINGGGSLHLLPSLLDLSFVNRNPADKSGRLERYLQQVDDDFDIILIDCPPTISVLTMAAFNASRYYLIPVTPDYFAPIGIPLIEEEVEHFLGNLHADSAEMIPLGIAYTIVDKRWHANWEEVANRVASASDIPAFESHFTYSKRWRDCAANHQPVYREPSSGNQQRQLEHFVDEFLERLEEAEDARE